MRERRRRSSHRLSLALSIAPLYPSLAPRFAVFLPTTCSSEHMHFDLIRNHPSTAPPGLSIQLLLWSPATHSFPPSPSLHIPIYISLSLHLSLSPITVILTTEHRRDVHRIRKGSVYPQVPRSKAKQNTIALQSSQQKTSQNTSSSERIKKSAHL